MRRHAAYIGVIRSTAVAVTIGFAWSSITLAAEPTSPPAPSPTVQEEKATPAESSDVQERALPRIGGKVAPDPAVKLTPKVMVPGVTGPLPGTPVPSQPAPAPGTGPLPVVGGTNERDYLYPWVVRLTGYGCAGVVIHPQWVLTAAHCVTPRIGFSGVTYTRTDSYGNVQKDTRAPAAGVGSSPGVNPGVFIHPNYAPQQDHANDIALIKLAQPFPVNFVLQTVGLPWYSRVFGRVGTVASYARHDGTPVPPGQIAIFRGPIAELDSPTRIFVQANAAGASLCPGDSGSGFVTVENGRAIVRGVASLGTVGDCMTPSGEAVFTDVFVFRGWILQTMGMTNVSFSGNVKVRRSGFGASGKIVMGCSHPNTPYWGPLNVVGVEEGAVCDGGQAHGIMCQLDPNQANTRFGPPQIVGFTMWEKNANGASAVTPLPFVSNLAQFAGPLPAGASREFTCQIGTSLTAATGAITGANTAVMSRGIEGESDGEPSIEQPSPFDPSEEGKP